MPPQELDLVRMLLHTTTRQDWLKWLQEPCTRRVSQALKRVLLESRAERMASDADLTTELMRLVKKEPAFRRFVVAKSVTMLDHITAQHLQQKLTKS